MNDRIANIYGRLLKKEYKALRSGTTYEFASQYAAQNLAYPLRVSDRLTRLVKAEKAVLFADDRIGMMRTIQKIPPIFTEEEKKRIADSHFIHTGAHINNIAGDYEKTLRMGLGAKRKQIKAALRTERNEEKRIEYQAMIQSIDAVCLLAEKYRVAAEEMEISALANALRVVPENPPKSFYQALVMMRLLNFSLWLNGNRHITVGRFDVYMHPYYRADLENGTLTREEALALIQEFFIDLNFDADLYPGVQQGDNGQSLVLGGCDEAGNSVYNDLSKLCLEASLGLKIIDPKINLRVDKNTPFDLYMLGTELTKQGLGFPQYSNDDVVIPALVDMGYDLRDARNYVVAACWEFIVPGVAMDIVNLDALSFPKVVREAVLAYLPATETFPELMNRVKEGIGRECDRIIAATENLYLIPSPLQSVLMTDCVERGEDVANGAKYNNYGIHGAGVANAADSLAAVKKYIYDEKTLSPERLIAAIECDFEGCPDVRNLLLQAPKFGNNDDYVDEIAKELLNDFADSLAGKRNDRGGIFRAGTGSAMYYIWFGETLGATPDGRKAGAPFAANYSPSLDVKLDGVLSVVQSFTKPDLKRVCNGGPLTLEFHDTVFKNEDGTQKVAALVQYFIRKGGHQLQLNAVNREKMLDAQRHPEKYPNLIVRVWGWSGYFNELDVVYQNHIIRRMEFLN